MMMRAIAESSQLHPRADDVMERNIREQEVTNTDYDPNPHGYWMHSWTDIDKHPETEQEVHKLPHNTLAKLRPAQSLRLHPGEYRIVMMRRKTSEIQESYERSFGVYRELAQDVVDLACAERIFTVRSDVSCITLQYADVVRSPLICFSKLKSEGWPIDAEIAASTVDPALYRHRHQED